MELLLKYLAWPAVVLLLGLVAIFHFRDPLTRLLDRTKKVGKTGLETVGSSQEGEIQVKPSAGEELQKLFDNQLLVQRETFIRTELDRLGIAPGNDRERLLVRLLAAATIAHSFESAYFVIWGSQIAALQFLNSAGVSGVDAALLRPWYDQAAARDPERYQGYSFDQWLGYLQGNLLILRQGNHVAITLEGREFLKYLLHQGYFLYKPG